MRLLNFCEQVLEVPRHGYDPAKMRIRGPGQVKVEGKLPEGGGDEREEAPMLQSRKMIDKCLYRKAFALLKMGEGGKALECLGKVESQTEETVRLREEAEKAQASY